MCGKLKVFCLLRNQLRATHATGGNLMRIVIIGDGKVGYNLTKQLANENHDIVVIDSNPRVLRESSDNLDIMVIHGNGATLAVQRKADVGKSDLLIAATSSDELNILCCILAKKLGCRNTISRVINREYAEQLQLLRDELGLSMTVNLDLISAREIFGLVQFPSFLKRDSFAKGRVELVEYKISSDSHLVGLRIDRLEEALRMKILVCAVERGDKIIIPKGSFVFDEGDTIAVTAPRSDLAKLVKKLDIANHKIRSVMIVGGSRIAAYLTDDLLKSNVKVKIIEQNPARCRELAEMFSDALIICGDGTSQSLLLEEGIKETDAVISLTNIDEENMLVSMFADYVGVPKTITKISRSEYSQLLSEKGIGSMICPKQLVANEVLRYVRAMENTLGGSVLTLHRMVGDKVEALEFIAQAATLHKGVPLSKLKLKEDVLISSITRSGKIIIPQGRDFIQEGDTVIVVTTAERMFSDLNDIFDETV